MTMIIAEISGNHGGDVDKAQRLIIAAAKCGCDAVKFQFYAPDDMPDDGGDYQKWAVPVTWLPAMFDIARAWEVELFASVFAPWALSFLRVYRPFAYKIASPESTRLSEQTYRKLVSAIKDEGAELYVSSGRADAEMMRSLDPDVFFYCKQGYPARLEDSDLRYMASIRGGFSDHTPDVASPLAMIQAGATHIEKHFKLDDDCVDAAFSLNPEQMKLLCKLAHRS